MPYAAATGCAGFGALRRHAEGLLTGGAERVAEATALALLEEDDHDQDEGREDEEDVEPRLDELEAQANVQVVDEVLDSGFKGLCRHPRMHSRRGLSQK